MDRLHETTASSLKEIHSMMPRGSRCCHPSSAGIAVYAAPSRALLFSSFIHSVLTGHLLCQSGLGVVEHR